MSDHVLREWEEKPERAVRRQKVLDLDFEKFKSFSYYNFLVKDLREEQECWIPQGRTAKSVRKELASWLGIRPAIVPGKRRRDSYYYSKFGVFVCRCPQSEECIRPSHQEVMNQRMEILP